MLEDHIKEVAASRGAKAVGVAPTERLDEHPSMDATYVMPGAKSIVSYMVSFKDETIRRYLSKEDRLSMQQEETNLYRQLDRIGRAIAFQLRASGYHAVVVETNLDYRFKDSTGYRRVPYELKQAIVDWMSSKSGRLESGLKRALAPVLYDKGIGAIDWNLTPSFSHRYGAIAAGTGSMGWSGNVLHPDYGARVLYGTVVTDAKLYPDQMMLADDSPCDGCRSCTKVCQSNFIEKKRKARVTIGGHTQVHAAKAHNLRCVLVCAGFSGQSNHRGWSTWSPGRFKLPESDDNLEAFWRELVLGNFWKQNHTSKVLGDLVFHTEHGHVHKPLDRFEITCGYCQFVCAAKRAQRKANVALIRDSGEIVA